MLLKVLLTFLLVQGAMAGERHTITISDDLAILPLSERVYVHISTGSAPGFGRFTSNGMIYCVEGKAMLFDTPMTDSLTRDLVAWITDSLHASIVGFVANHWHADCIGGLAYLEWLGIPSYASEKTIAETQMHHVAVPENGFSDSLVLRVGGAPVVCRYFGPGHTKDNIVAWLPAENILFGGCMIRSVHATTRGNIEDADLDAWPKTVSRIVDAYGSLATFVIPGHGEVGGPELLTHTISLLAPGDRY